MFRFKNLTEQRFIYGFIFIISGIRIALDFINQIQDGSFYEILISFLIPLVFLLTGLSFMFINSEKYKVLNLLKVLAYFLLVYLLLM